MVQIPCQLKLTAEINGAKVVFIFNTTKFLMKNYMENPPSMTKSWPVSQLEASLKR